MVKKIFIMLLVTISVQAEWRKRSGKWTYTRNPFEFEEIDRKVFIDENGAELKERPADFNGDEA